MIFQTLLLIFIVVRWNNVSAVVSDRIPQVTLVYLDMEMIQHVKSFFLSLTVDQKKDSNWYNG